MDERAEEAIARGARHVATVAALRLATNPFEGDRDHAVAVAALRAFAATSEPARRPQVVSLIDAGPWAEAERRMSVGLCPRIERLCGWRDGLDDVDAPRRPSAAELAAADLARYTDSRTAVDVDLALARSIDVVKNLMALPSEGRTTEGAWRTLADAALALCVDPPALRMERLDRRRALMHLGLTLRRRRPLVTAVLRRRLGLERNAWPGPVA